MCRLAYMRSRYLCDKTSYGGKFSNYKRIHNKILAHHTLPIQTTRDQIEQPVQLLKGWTMCFVGEIYDYGFEYRNDVEFLMRTFNPADIPGWMSKLTKYDGMWAILVIKDKKWYACTDPLGKKQLFYNRKGEINSEAYPLSDGLSMRRISEFARMGFTNSHLTVYKDVAKMRPGYIYSDEGRLFKTTIPQIKLTNDLESQFYSLMAEAVNQRVIKSLVPVSTFISGGLDSSIIAHHIQKWKYNTKYYTAPNSIDEHFVAKVGVEYEMLDSGDVDINEALEANQSPWDLGSMVPQYLLCKSAYADVIITGDGADELFGGYDRNHYYDSFYGDIEELSYYHLPRLDLMASRFCKEIRSPFLSHPIVSFASQLPYDLRSGKKLLKNIYRGQIHDDIINRKKFPLKNPKIRKNEKTYRYRLIQKFIENYESPQF